VPKIIGNPEAKNNELKELIHKTKINNFYIKNHKNFREQILSQINLRDDVLDIGKSMREEFSKIKSKTLDTLDVNLFKDYPDIVFDLCDDLALEHGTKFDKDVLDIHTRWGTHYEPNAKGIDLRIKRLKSEIKELEEWKNI